MLHSILYLWKDFSYLISLDFGTRATRFWWAWQVKSPNLSRDTDPEHQVWALKLGSFESEVCAPR